MDRSEAASVHSSATHVEFIGEASMLDLHEFLEDIGLALLALGRGESFWRSLAFYLSISVIFALIGVAIWRAWQ